MDIQKIKELALANGFKLKEQASGNLDLNAYVYDFANAIEREVKAQAVPEGFVLVKKVHPDAIVHNQGLGLFKECQVIYGWDGKSKDFKDALNKGFYHGVKLGAKAVLETAMIEAQEPQITELKVEWASDCFKCGHHEAIIYSTAAEASTKGWFHDGDEAKCTGCGNTGEMDARGEDSDICWNEDEAND